MGTHTQVTWHELLVIQFQSADQEEKKNNFLWARSTEVIQWQVSEFQRRRPWCAGAADVQTFVHGVHQPTRLTGVDSWLATGFQTIPWCGGCNRPFDWLIYSFIYSLIDWFDSLVGECMRVRLLHCTQCCRHRRPSNVSHWILNRGDIDRGRRQTTAAGIMSLNNDSIPI